MIPSLTAMKNARYLQHRGHADDYHLSTMVSQRLQHCLVQIREDCMMLKKREDQYDRGRRPIHWVPKTTGTKSGASATMPMKAGNAIKPAKAVLL